MEKDTIFKKATDFCEAMRGKLFYVIDVSVLWVVGAYCNDLIILLSLDYSYEEKSFGDHELTKRNSRQTLVGFEVLIMGGLTSRSLPGQS